MRARSCTALPRWRCASVIAPPRVDPQRSGAGVWSDESLGPAAAREPVPALDEAAILAEHRAIIGEGTHFYRSREAMHYPPPVADEIIARMLQQGMIRKEVTQNR